MKRKTRRLFFFFATLGFLAVACVVVGSLVLGRGGSGGSGGSGGLQLAAPKDLQGFVLSIYLNTRSGDLTAPAGRDDTPRVIHMSGARAERHRQSAAIGETDQGP